MITADDPDAFLIRALQSAGDTRLFSQLIERYRDYVYNFSFRFLGNEDDAADCSQEVFIRIYLSIKGFRFKSRFSTWLYRVTMNTCLEMARSNKRRGSQVSINQVEAWSSDDPADYLERKEIDAAFQSALARLKLMARTMLIMRDLEGRSYEEISVVTGKRPGTVRSTIARARLKVSDGLKEYRNEK